MLSKTKKNKVKFLMDTDWVFQGILDSEQKEYILLNYFQKLNKDLEEMKIYPMFTELSLHLGNIQTLSKQNQILYTNKVLKSFDDELVLSDLKLKDVPQMDNNEFSEYQKILKYSQPKLFDYFNITKAFWTLVYDSIRINIKKNKTNLSSKSGFFYYISNDKVHIWKYTLKKLGKSTNELKTDVELLYSEKKNDLTISKIITKLSENYYKEKQNKYPVFELVCKDIFPLEETLIPIFKRKVMTYINQQVKLNELKEKNINDGVS